MLQLAVILSTLSTFGCQAIVKSAARSAMVANPPASSNTPNRPAPAPLVDKEYEQYRQQVLQKFLNKDFSWIDHEAHRVRTNKERLPGGYWKLRALYGALENPAAGDRASDGEWEDWFQALAAWSQSQPNSVTAKVAEAAAWKKYAWEARGDGYGGSVSETAWQEFRNRLKRASDVLSQAVPLQEHCPYWYETAIWVGMGQGMDHAILERIFKAGVALEPTFYYLYQSKASYLLPRWGGNEGDWERFADDSALAVGGNQGDIIFFTIYSQMLSLDGMALMNNHQQAVPHLIAGFRSIEKLYGSSRHRLNEVCLFASFSNELQASAEFFQRIGDDYDPEVWKSKQTFEIFRQGMEQRAKAAQPQSPNSGQSVTLAKPR
jgi:hypothetical protein